MGDKRKLLPYFTPRQSLHLFLTDVVLLKTQRTYYWKLYKLNIRYINIDSVSLYYNGGIKNCKLRGLGAWGAFKEHILCRNHIMQTSPTDSLVNNTKAGGTASFLNISHMSLNSKRPILGTLSLIRTEESLPTRAAYRAHYTSKERPVFGHCISQKNVL